MIGFINNRKQKVNTDDLHNPTGAYIRDNYLTYIYTESEAFIESFLKENESSGFIGFTGTNKAVKDYLLKNHLLHWENTCNQYHFPHHPFKTEDISDQVESLTIEDTQFCTDHYEYKMEETFAKVEDAISNRPSSCMRLNDEIVSYVMLHEDDSLGYMYTQPEHRGKGYAWELTKDIVNKTLKTGRLPYIQIVQGNTKSEQLALKAGFVKHGVVYWFGILNVKGKEFKEFKETYEKHFGEQATFAITKLCLTKGFELIEVETVKTEKDFLVKYNKKEYTFKYIIDDDLYYIDVLDKTMPIDVLRSGLIKLLENDFDFTIINEFNEITEILFKKIK